MDENGEWRRLHKEELHSLYCSPNIVTVSAGFSTTSALGEISTAPPNCNSNPYEKRQRIFIKINKISVATIKIFLLLGNLRVSIGFG